MGRARSLGSTQQSVCLSCHDGHLSCPQSVWEEFFSLLREEGREGEREGGRRGVERAGGGGWVMEKGRIFWEDGRKEKGEDGRQGGFIDCSQAEGGVWGAWRRALRTPGLSLLSGPVSEAYGPSRGCGGIGAGISGSCEQPGSVFL